MAHNGNSKIESINLKITPELNEFLELLANKNPKSEVCKTKLVHKFMIYGLFTAFTEDIEYDLSNFEWVLKNISKTENKLPGIINRVNLGLNSKVE